MIRFEVSVAIGDKVATAWVVSETIDQALTDVQEAGLECLHDVICGGGPDEMERENEQTK